MILVIGLHSFLIIIDTTKWLLNGVFLKKIIMLMFLPLYFFSFKKYFINENYQI